jgi:hypothetical protein
MNAYFDTKNPGSFGGIARLREATNNKDAKRWLSWQETYTLHKPIRRKFKRRKYQTSGIDDLWQADLAEMSDTASENGGVKYLLVVIDVFSKFLWVEPMTDKRAVTCISAFERILDRASPRQPMYLMTDKGTEFASFKNRLKERKISYYTGENQETKAAVAERVIRTLKGRIYRLMTYRKSKSYIDKLQDLVYAYNHSKHRSIGMKPVQVTPETVAIVKQRLYPLPKGKIRYNFEIGDKVRLAKSQSAFEKGYKPRWTIETFTISKRKATNPPVYEVKDLNGETILGSFYEQEMQKVNIYSESESEF